jgi:RecB family exonuclease
MSRDLLTASRIGALQRCPRYHYLRYEVGLKSPTDAAALRFGSAWHLAMEARWRGSNLDVAFAAAVVADTLVEFVLATLSGLLAG